MKRQKGKGVFRKSVFSVLVLAFFMLMATGSVSYIQMFTQQIFPGPQNQANRDRIVTLIGEVIQERVHQRDSYGKPHGETTERMGKYEGGEISDEKTEMDVRYEENGNQEHGSREGECTVTSRDLIELMNCHLNFVILKTRIQHIQGKSGAVEEDNSAYQILSQEYPFRWLKLYAFEFDSVYMESYMDTLELLLSSYEKEEDLFDDYYSEVIEILEETPYDSIIEANSLLSLLLGLEELKGSELRMALIDRYRAGASSTFDLVKSTYPGYMEKMYMGDVSDAGFEEFCRVLDSSMSSYGALDTEDPLFLDSIDARMFRALDGMMPSFKSASSMKHAMKGMNFNTLHKYSETINESITEDVAEVVFFFMFMRFDQGDLIKKAVKKAWCKSNGLITGPQVGTGFDSHVSATGVVLNGYIFEDGGAQVTSGGIVWAQTYNPTLEDHVLSSGTAIGEYSVTLEGLTEGETYYARAYAINSADTAYGNCVSFVAEASEPEGTGEEEISEEMNIWPNPAFERANLSFWIDSEEAVSVQMIGMNGQVLYQKEIGVLPAGQHNVEIDLSGFQAGAYHCVLKYQNRTVNSRKLLVIK